MEKIETKNTVDSPAPQKIGLDANERIRRLREIQLPMSRKIIKHPDFEIAWPEKVSVVGFCVITAICILILFSTWYAGKLLAGL